MSFAATLNKRVLLQRLSGAQDEAGQPGVAGWVNVIESGDGKIWAGIRDVSGREFVAAGGTQNSVITTITIRHLPNVQASMRVLHGDDVYNIESVLGTEGRNLKLMCKRGVS
ncbi:phage head closure protein [Duganella sp. FT135W]|uniref:Phage head closure protein n=1 Tax=Duganella flavida TaxID=2692175 RepID=A0A6L8KHW0_9BURK|nr:phage head closure protein [Duganella flavida]MYM25778.1 phage head closure protein [Duganella flavida]